ncbi:DUF2188 domain-containing protein [Leucobacter sp. L43]|uniref:DUF2188 domain-containing protein n=1 Tax=Leucobacter sp. L43 TaxID=2798040 RepID=UPI00351C3BB0
MTETRQSYPATTQKRGKQQEDSAMSQLTVTTKSKNGQWVNEVEGAPHLSRSFRDKEEAVQAAREFAAAHDREHRIEESDPTGAITDPDPASSREAESADPNPQVPFSEPG